MPLKDPKRGILALLTVQPMTSEELEARVDNGAALAEAMGQAGEIVRGEDERWAIRATAPSCR